MEYPVNKGFASLEEKIAYNKKVVEYNTLNCPEDGVVSAQGEIRTKTGQFIIGYPHLAQLKDGRRVSSKKRREELRQRFADGSLTDPLEFLLDVVHNASGDESRKDQIECAKSALSFIYAKPTVEIHTTSDTPDLSLQDVKTRMLSILDIVDSSPKGDAETDTGE